jgi:hypothetical protein
MLPIIPNPEREVWAAFVLAAQNLYATSLLWAGNTFGSVASALDYPARLTALEVRRERSDSTAEALARPRRASAVRRNGSEHKGLSFIDFL